VLSSGDRTHTQRGSTTRTGANNLAAMRGLRPAKGSGLNGVDFHEQGSNMARRKQQELIRGHAVHRRTEGDYMSVLLEAVTLDDWRAVVNHAKTLAQAGDAQARAWLAQYLMGKPAGSAPTPLTVVVQQLNGADPLIEKLTQKAIHSATFPDTNEGWKDGIRALVASEVAQKVRAVETIEGPATARASGPSVAE
jgi:hypothetical protein